jgi:hypothetical protein
VTSRKPTDIDGVRRLASMFRSDQPARPVLLLGAGASFSSGIPMAAECVRRIARRVYADRVAPDHQTAERIKPSEWQEWLRTYDWFISDEGRIAENFPLVVEHLLRPQEYRREIFREILTSTAPIGPGYRRLAELMLRGLVRTVLTTNFDRCIPDAVRLLGPSMRPLVEVNKSVADLKQFDLYARAQLVWLHGTAEHYTDRNLVREVVKLDEGLVSMLRPLLGSSPLIVAGYGGAEASIMEHLLGDPASTNDFKRGVFWCVRHKDTSHPNVEALGRRLGSNFELVRIDGFDELLEGLTQELVGEDLYQSARPRMSSSEAPDETPYDDTAMTGTTLADLDEDEMLATMMRYCEGLGRAPVSRATLPALLAELGLLIDVSGETIPTRGCILLFGREPQRFIAHAVSEATIAGKKRQVFAGNLLSQHRALAAWLDGQEVNPRLTVKARTAHVERRAFPELALIELTVNALVHRDYALQEPVLIDTMPDQGRITFASPGALPASLAGRLSPDLDGSFQPKELGSHPRNRSLCDVFFGLKLMQRAGTGLLDVEDLARGGGGRAAFRTDTVQGRFEATISGPEMSAGSRHVARDNRPIATYVINSLPVVAMPPTVSVVRLRLPLRNKPSTLDLTEAGTFVHGDSEHLVSFVPLALLCSILGDIAAPADSREVDTVAFDLEPQGRNQLSWLLRKHFERHLRGFQASGLMLECDLPRRGRQRRAYFFGESKGRELIYDASVRKGVRRQVVKSRGEPGRGAWFENEGFSYAIVGGSQGWAVRIKPFYMFTGPDARTPIASFLQGSKATRRFKFDRNKNVEDDLTFWGRFIGSGQPVINVGQQHVGDLLLQGSFLSVEVPL